MKYRSHNGESISEIGLGGYALSGAYRNKREVYPKCRIDFHISCHEPLTPRQIKMVE